MYPLTQPSDVISVLALVTAAALLHATIQSTSSFMTLLSGHALGAGKSHKRLLYLCSYYCLGSGFMIGLLMIGLTYVVSTLPGDLGILWALTCSFGIITAGAIILFYILRPGNNRWLPSAAATYLRERTKHTSSGVESFGLGIMTTLAELPFILAPLLLVSMVLKGDPDAPKLGVVVIYCFIAVLPLIVTLFAIGSGVKISRLEKNRDDNQAFLQLVCAAGLMVLSVYAFTLFGVDYRSLL